MVVCVYWMCIVDSMSVCSGAITTTAEWQEKSKHSTNTAVIINRPGILSSLSVREYV